MLSNNLRVTIAQHAVGGELRGSRSRNFLLYNNEAGPQPAESAQAFFGNKDTASNNPLSEIIE
ncbi:hypothetical protein [Paraburkholderia sp. MM5482-R1]